MLGKEDSYRTTVLKDYIHAFIGRDTPIPIILFFIFALLLLLFVFRTKNTKQGKVSKFILIFTIAEVVAYLLGLGLTYLYKFTYVEALKLADFFRYTGIIKNFLLFTTFLSFVELYSFWDIPKYSLCTAALVLFLLFGIQTDPIVSVFSRVQVRQSREYRDYFTELTAKILNNTENDSKIGVLSSSADEMDNLIIRYNALPRDTEGVMRYIEENATDEEISKMLQSSYDYIAIFWLNQDSVDRYKGIFENSEDIHDNSVYYFNPESGKLVLLD